MTDDERIPVSWYDGQSAARHDGWAALEGPGTIRLRSDWGDDVAVAADDLRHVDSRRDSHVYALGSNDNFRLTVPRDLPASFDAVLPGEARYGGWVDRFGLIKASIAFGLVSAAALSAFLTAPEWLGPRVPETWERRLGDAMIGDFGNRLCSTPYGDEAIAKMVEAVDPGAEKVRVGVANIDMVNAVALPGGQILLFDGLIQEAESVEEVVGVLAHEVGHVRERHVMTSVLRQFGLSILLSGFNSSFADTAFGVASLDYSRDAEREADSYARARLQEASISPLGTAAFFERMIEQYGGDEDGEPAIVGWIATHPSSGERAKAFRDAHEKGRNYRPVLTEAEFGALKTMCEEDEDVEDFDMFF
ncbi:M48 family metallopeptidase [Altererythrobacter sp. MF3-039]|uniref:M48 family metallopeptidase n=1 Tax=Altererythrobacter sp. MF3-039 TaxID=3252901 RepID=UPI00390C6A14